MRLNSLVQSPINWFRQGRTFTLIIPPKSNPQVIVDIVEECLDDVDAFESDYTEEEIMEICKKGGNYTFSFK